MLRSQDEKRLKQVGPTCGFYALVYAVSRIQRIDFQAEATRVISYYLQTKDSKVGEIFDVNIMKKIVDEQYPDIKAHIRDVNCKEDIAKLLKDNFVILPCLHEGVPHYVFVEAYNDNQCIVRHNHFSKVVYMSFEELWELHQQLAEKDSYEWNDFYYKRKSVSYNIDLLINTIKMDAMNYKLNRLLISYKKAMNGKLKDKKQKLNMYHKVVVIQR